MKKLFLRLWPIGFIVAIWFIFASPYFIKRLVPFSSKYLVTFFAPWSAAYGMPVKNNAMPDVATQIYPWKRVTIETWKMGQVPLWNPYSFSGTPHLGNYQSAVLSPINFLFFIIPEIDAWSVMILLQPLLAGFFMYFLLRTLDKSQAGSLIGSLSFMFCGFMTVWMAYGTLGWAVLWLPFLFALVIRHFNKRSIWNVVLLTIALPWSFFSGHFQMSVYVLLAVIAFVIFQTMKSKKLHAGGEIALGIISGVLLSMPQILPSIEAYQHSVRSQLFTQTGGIAWQYLITLFAPDFFGNPVTRNDWFGYYAEWASFVGVMPLLLGLYAVVSKKSKEIWFFFGLAMASLFVAFPTPLNALVTALKLPAVSTSYSVRIIVLTSFSLSVLSAFGLDTLITDWKNRKRETSFYYCLGIAIFLLLLWAIVIVVKPFPADKLLIAQRNLVLPTVLSVATVILFFLGFIKRRTVRTLILVVFIGLTAFDMLRYSTKWMPFDPKEYVFPKMNVITFLQQKIGNNRVFGNFGNELTGYFALQAIEGYDAVYQARYGEFLLSSADGKIHVPERSVAKINKYGANSEKVLEFLGVKYLLHRLSDGRYGWAYPYWTFSNYISIYKDEQYEVFENQKALPRAFFASSYVVAKKDQQILDTFYNKSFDFTRDVILEQEPSLKPQNGEGTIEISSYTPNQITFNTSSTVPKLLFLSDVFDSGWKAMVDGQPAKIYRADYDFRAVAVPAGDHRVLMKYRPDSFVRGLWLAGLGLSILLFRAIQSWYENRHR